MDAAIFEQFVAEALDRLPDPLREKLDNVEVVIEDWPDPQTLHAAGLGRREQLLGFYHGVPQTRRSHNYGLVLPDKISIYRRPIEMRCRTTEEIRRMVHRVVRHELAHHFGISDRRLRELDAY